MQIAKTVLEKSLVITPGGRLDTLSAGELEKECSGIPAGIETVILDFGLLRYISSAGLRVIIKAKKDLELQGIDFSIRNTQRNVMDVFRMTKFDEIINIS